jgi:rhodanese-related sulfurtransferase
MTTQPELAEKHLKTQISRDELKRRLDDKLPTLIFEALPEKYYLHAHIPGARQLDHHDVTPQLGALAPDAHATIVVYCASATCRNSDVAANRLVALGYADVRVYVEGKQDWLEAGLPVVRTEQAA